MLPELIQQAMQKIELLIFIRPYMVILCKAFK